MDLTEEGERFLSTALHAEFPRDTAKNKSVCDHHDAQSRVSVLACFLFVLAPS